MLTLLTALAFAAPLTLDEAVRRAGTDSHEATIAEARVDEAHASYGLARAGLLPQISASGQYRHWDDQIEFPNPFVDDGSMLIIQKQEAIDVGVTGSQVLFAPGAFARATQAHSQVDAVEAQSDGALADAETRAAQLWVQARQSYELLEAAKSNQAAAEAHLVTAERQLDAGAITQLGLDKAKINVGASKQRVIEAQRMYDDALGMLSIAVQEPVTELGDMPGPAIRDAGEDALITSALDNRPEIRAARAQVDAERAGKWAVAADWAPTISAVGGWRGTNNPGITGTATQWYVGLNATVPLIDGGTRFADAKKLNAQKTVTDETMARLEEQTREDVRSALRGEASAKEALELAIQQERLASDAHDQANSDFAQGAATELDVRDAEQALLDAKVSRIRAEGQVVLAGYQVRRVTGTP